MTTLFLELGGDLVLTGRGSLQTATGWDEARQRIERRICTNPEQTLPDGRTTQADYIFDQGYGEGLGTMVAEDFSAVTLAEIEQRITRGVLAAAAVVTTIPPTITFAQPNPNTLDINVSVLLIAGGVGEIQLQATRPGGA